MGMLSAHARKRLSCLFLRRFALDIGSVSSVPLVIGRSRSECRSPT
jgi:hypothetical protein